MAKMKKGKAHHWYKEEKDKVPKKSYVPTGERMQIKQAPVRNLCLPTYFVLREAARASKEGTRGGKSEVCAHRSPEGKEARPEE